LQVGRKYTMNDRDESNITWAYLREYVQHAKNASNMCSRTNSFFENALPEKSVNVHLKIIISCQLNGLASVAHSCMQNHW